MKRRKDPEPPEDRRDLYDDRPKCVYCDRWAIGYDRTFNPTCENHGPDIEPPKRNR